MSIMPCLGNLSCSWSLSNLVWVFLSVYRSVLFFFFFFNFLFNEIRAVYSLTWAIFVVVLSRFEHLKLCFSSNLDFFWGEFQLQGARLSCVSGVSWILSLPGIVFVDFRIERLDLNRMWTMRGCYFNPWRSPFFSPPLRSLLFHNLMNWQHSIAMVVCWLSF